jgi:hypothetical protein
MHCTIDHLVYLHKFSHHITKVCVCAHIHTHTSACMHSLLPVHTLAYTHARDISTLFDHTRCVSVILNLRAAGLFSMIWH